jgi:hypothetical protein
MRFLSLFLTMALAAGGQTALLQRHVPKRGVVFEFAAIGDQQYGPEGESKFPALRAAINRSGVAFAVHVGDIKNGESPCSDAMYQDRLRGFNQFEMPFILTPGDNEWTDCHRADAGGFDPLERLAHLRRVFYADNQSLGKRKMKLSRQSEDPAFAKFSENAMWSMGDTLFATIHVVGSANNRGRTPEADREFEERTAANRAWLKSTFAVARANGFARVVIAMQANPGWTGTPVLASSLKQGFRFTVATLGEEALAYAKPVLVAMGDSHTFRIDQPLRTEATKNTLETLLRLEVPGSPQAHWARVRIDPRQSAPFTFSYEPIPANYRPH